MTIDTYERFSQFLIIIIFELKLLIRLSDYEQREKAKAERDSALNSLESAVYDYQAKLEEAEFTRFGTNEVCLKTYFVIFN